MQDKVSHKPHRPKHAGPQAKRKKDKTKEEELQTARQRNPKAFALQSVTKTARAVRSGRQDTLEPPPIVVAVVGPPKVGKTTLVKCLVKNFTQQNLTAINGPVTLVSGKKRRLTVIECNNDMSSMIDVAKVADLVLLMVDASFGFEMETFEFLNIAQAHGFPKIMGVLTHLDGMRNNKALNKTKKRLKHRFWKEVYQGAKLFYLSGMMHGEYLRREIHNLGRFISVMKFRPLIWRTSHSYILADRMEDLTNPELIRQKEKCDRHISLYGYVRGTPLKLGGSIHLAGCGDFEIKDITHLPDPCPLPDKEKKRSLDTRERLIYAPMSGVGGIVYDKDVVYVELGPNKSRNRLSPGHIGEVEETERGQYTEETVLVNGRKRRRVKFDDEDGQSEEASSSEEDDDEGFEDERDGRLLTAKKREQNVAASSSKKNKMDFADFQFADSDDDLEMDILPKRKTEMKKDRKERMKDDDEDSSGDSSGEDGSEEDKTHRSRKIEGDEARKFRKSSDGKKIEGDQRRKGQRDDDGDDDDCEDDDDDDDDDEREIDDSISLDKRKKGERREKLTIQRQNIRTTDDGESEGEEGSSDDESSDDESDDSSTDDSKIENKRNSLAKKKGSDGVNLHENEESSNVGSKRSKKENNKLSDREMKGKSGFGNKQNDKVGKSKGKVTTTRSSKEGSKEEKLIEEEEFESASSEGDQDEEMEEVEGENREEDEEEAEEDDKFSSSDQDESKEEEGKLKWKENLVEKASAAFIRQQQNTPNLRKLVYGEVVENDSDGETEVLGGFLTLSKPSEDEEKLSRGKDGQDTSGFPVKHIRDWDLDEVRELIADCFVTGKWEADEDAETLLEKDDELYGDFEDLETGEVHKGDPEKQTNERSSEEEDEDGDEEEKAEGEVGGEAKTALSVQDEDKQERERRMEKKRKAKMGLLEDEEEGPSFFDEWKEEMDQQSKLNRAEFQDMDDSVRTQYEGFRPGMYVRVEVADVPFEFVTNFDPTCPMVLGGLLSSESSIGFVQIRLKKHRWYPKILKTRDPLIFSVGWRRFQTIPLYCIQDHNGRNRLLKYTPEHLHCIATIWGPITPQGTGILAVQSISGREPGFRIAATGVILDLDKSINIVKKLKLTGVPLKIHKNTAFIQGMFNSALEVAKFEGALIRTVSGIRGQIKKASKAPPGAFRASFEDKLLRSDIVFLRTWYQVQLPKFYNPVTNMLLPKEQKGTWKGMRTVGQLRRDNNIPLPVNQDSLYKAIQRKPRRFNRLVIPRKLAQELPFKYRPQQRQRKDGLTIAGTRAVIREPHERKIAALMQELGALYKDKKRRDREDREKKSTENKKRMKVEEEKLMNRQKKDKREMFRLLGQMKKKTKY
ncbi:putative ribosome biogenesis protein BMS1-like [Apostichopus japonicus]|uniref:Putative ribosome biogenesis protein BMS1-like n=1 Tax=Stichopus japonicus TaxID=307972 RepID=A0A2G8K3Q7_STIJA|nr:putative ribosome biogenesis protein BMS1-like [Apostichopus japonicus]